MSSCPQMSQDGTHVNEGESKVQEAEDPDLELPPPVVTRTRSGRRVRTPATLLDSEVSSIKTPSRRGRKSVIQEISASNPEISTEPQHESADVESVVEVIGKTDTHIGPKSTTGKSSVEDLSSCPLLKESVCPDSIVSTPVDNVVDKTSVSDSSVRLNSDRTSEKENQVNAMEVSVSHPEKTAKKRSHSESSDNVKPSQTIPLGKPKSGRVWKDRNKQRFSALLRDKPLRTSWEKKMEAKRDRELVKKYHTQLKEDKAREKQEKRMRRQETLKRRTENERKAEIVQVIRNTAKIKRMKKKQLRKIEKRDTLSLLQKPQPRNLKGSGKGGKGN